MVNLIDILYQIMQSPFIFNLSICIAVIVKCYLLYVLISQRSNTTNRTSWLLLVSTLIGASLGDLSWIIKIVRAYLIPSLPYAVSVFSIRIAWAALIIEYQSLALFIESLTKKQYSLDRMHKFILMISSLFAGYFLYMAAIDTTLTNELERSAAFTANNGALSFEVVLMKYVSMYLLPIIIFPSLYMAFRNIKHEKLPRILKRQLTVLIKYLLCPFLMAEFIIALQLNVHNLGIFRNGLLSFSTLFISMSLYYCITSIIRLRFLNFQQQLPGMQRPNFINSFKEILDQLSKIKNQDELNQITQSFFKEAFNIPLKKTTLIILSDPDKTKKTFDAKEKLIEDFIVHNQPVMDGLPGSSKILIYDDLSFNAFYDQETVYQEMLLFLESMNAELFVPIYQKNKIIAAITVETNARTTFYNAADRDEMLIFGNYISIVINLLYHRNLDQLIAYEKELKEELFFKHKEISLYKESIRSFLENDPLKKIGILFYKHDHFMYGNQAAKELIPFDLNEQDGHPLTKKLKSIGQQVETYTIPQTHMYYGDGQKLMLSAMLNLEKNNVIMVIYYPEIADIIKKQASLLHDPTEWDYLLYLETTQVGTMINNVIPGKCDILTHFKVQLIKAGMSKKAVLLESAPDDLYSLVELLHSMSLKSLLHIISLKEPVKDKSYLIKLFGINPLISRKDTEKPILEKLDKTGTLFIENIHFLDGEAQEYLADYLKMGFFRIYKSDQKVVSTIRFICSTNQNLSLMVSEGKFSHNLFQELKKVSLHAPSLLSLSPDDFNDMIDDIIAQQLKAENFKHMLEISHKDRTRLIAVRSQSFIELKKKINNILITKSKKNNMFQEVQLEPAQITLDQHLMQAALLGKHALKDQKTMVLLWDKFKNQNKIATFLGVNRSSVNRRCKEFNLI